MIKTFKIILLISLVFWVNTGFAVDGTTTPEQLAKTMDAKINKMTYDDALSSFGQPTSITQGDEIFVAVWRTERFSRDIDPSKLFGLTSDDVAQIYAAVPPTSHGEEVQLTFSKSTRLLKAWKYRNW